MINHCYCDNDDKAARVLRRCVSKGGQQSTWVMASLHAINGHFSSCVVVVAVVAFCGCGWLSSCVVISHGCVGILRDCVMVIVIGCCGCNVVSRGCNVVDAVVLSFPAVASSFPVVMTWLLQSLCLAVVVGCRVCIISCSCVIVSCGCVMVVVVGCIHFILVAVSTPIAITNIDTYYLHTIKWYVTKLITNATMGHFWYYQSLLVLTISISCCIVSCKTNQQFLNIIFPQTYSTAYKRSHNSYLLLIFSSL